MPQTGWLNSRNVIFSQLWQSTMKVSAGLLPLEASLLGLQIVALMWPFLCARASLVPFPLFIVLQDQGPPIMTSLNLNYLLKGPVSEQSLTGGQGFNL